MTLRNMSEEQCAWVAGLLEGEGSFTNASESEFSRYGRVSCGSTDLDVLERLQEWTGVGSIHTVKRIVPKPGKQMYTWIVSKQLDVYMLARHIKVYMCGRRRDRLEEMIELMPDKHHGVYLATLADEVRVGWRSGE